MSTVCALLVFLCSAALATTNAEGFTLTDVIHTTTGPIQGHHPFLKNYKQFLGIPFAEPPVGDLRFANPLPKTPWTKTFKATSLGASCPQLEPVKHIYLGNEDCLKLDVYVPSKPATTEPLPVYVWIYGGGYVLGDKNEFGIYGPGDSFMLDSDIIFVAINYRLGPLGFLALDGLKGTVGSTGNQALLDQVLGMQWVHDNIAQFGGNPAQVTIGGESAGAFSVCWHLASPLARGLFSAALMESGTCDSDEFFRDYANAVSFSKAFALANKCDGPSDEAIIHCMRQVSVADLISMSPVMEPFKASHFVPLLYPAMPWAPVIDGVAMPAKPLHVIQSGKANNVPLLIGTNADEGSLFEFFIPANWTKVFTFLQMHFFPDPKLFKAVVSFYNVSEHDSDIKAKSVALLTDYFFKCPTRRAVRAVKAAGEKAWEYQFTFKDSLVEKLIGDGHATELVYVFGHPAYTLGFSDKDRHMSMSFVHYWTNFVRLHEPSGTNSNTTRFPTWLASDASGSYLDLDTPPVLRQFLDFPACDFWDKWALA